MRNGTFDFRVDDFCQGCGDFEPKVTKYDCTPWECPFAMTGTIVTCEHNEDCRNKINENIRKVQL